MEPADDPIPEPASAPSPAPRRARVRLVPVAALLLAASLPLAWLTYPSTGDAALSSAAQGTRAQVYQRAGALPLPVVSLQERASALDAMKLPAEQLAVLEQQLRAQNTELVWLTLWDDCDQDGDVVMVESDAFRQRVPIAHAPRRIAIPRPTSGVVNLTGVHDGGGGITIAVATVTGKVAVPVMVPGQVLGIPVR